MHPGPGPLALVGSGEYLEVMADVEGALIAGRPRRYVQIPTAAAPEGPGRLRYWLDLGAAQAERLGVQPVPVLVRKRLSPSFHSPVVLSRNRGVDATRNFATGCPDGVNRSSGSSTRLPAIVIWVSPAAICLLSV